MRLIDADALMAELAEFVRPSNNSDFAPVPTWNDAVSLLGSAPTIERKKGKWKKHRESFCSWSCSVCKEIVVAMPEQTGYPLYDYCPNCGADMRETT